MYTLSGGQKSRVAFAKVTFSKPHILLLDEPSNHLDLDAVNALIQVGCRPGIMLNPDVNVKTCSTRNAVEHHL